MERNAFFDNARAMLIFLVVFGHMIQPFTAESASLHTIYVWIYIFHMPAFIVISGLFARGAGDRSYIWNLVKKLLFPYFIFQIIYTGYYYLIEKPGWQAGLFEPQWSLWFLISLFSWHILLIIFKKIKPIYGISLAVLIGLGIGYFSGVGHTFSLSRTFVFFPYFLIGYWLTEKQLMFVKRKGVRITGLVVMALMVLFIYYSPEFNTGWLLGSKAYADLGVESTGGFIRLLIYLLSALMVTSVLAWIPANRIKNVTHLGTRTLYVYLLHGFIIQYFRQADLFSVHSVLDVVGLIAISAGLVFVLSSNPITSIFQPLIEGRAKMLKEKLS